MSIVPTGYRDYSTYLKNGGELIQHKKSNRNFPVKLHRIVSNPNNSHVIKWMSHGRAFKVLKRDELVRDVIPGHFQCAKYESFTRQLTAWDFRRCKRGPDEGCYYHETFLRGLPELTCFIRRIPRDCRKSDRKIIVPEEDPVPPLPSTQDQESSVLQRREYHEQSSQMDENDDVSHGGDDLDLAGYREDNDIRPTQMPPPQHGSDKSNYQAIEEHYQHDHQVPVHCPPVGHSDLGAPPSDAHAWGDAGSSDHYDAHYHYGTQGSHCNNPHYHVSHPGHSSREELGYIPPSNGPSLSEQSHLSHQKHAQGHGHYARQGQGYQYLYGTHGHHYDNPHYHPRLPQLSHLSYIHHPSSHYYPPPDYPAYYGYWQSPNHAHTIPHHSYQAATAQGQASHEEADEKERSW